MIFPVAVKENLFFALLTDFIFGILIKLIVFQILCNYKVLLFLGSDNDKHLLTFEFGLGFQFPDFVQFFDKSFEKLAALVLKKDGAASEKHIGSHFCAAFKETFRMFYLKIEIVFVGLRSETYFLDYDFRAFGFHFFLFLFELIQKFAVVDNLTYRRIGGRCNFYQIRIFSFGHGQSFFEGVNTLLDIFSYYAYYRSLDHTYGLHLFVLPLLVL